VRLRPLKWFWLAIVACGGTLLTVSVAAEPLLSDAPRHGRHGMIPVRALAFPLIIILWLCYAVAERIRKALKRRKR